MKKKILQMTALLCVSALIISAAYGTFFPGEVLAQEDTDPRTDDESAYDADAQMTLVADAAQEIRKEETVYVIAAPDGSATQVIVSDHLENKSESAGIGDLTTLTDIENVKGDERFIRQDGNELIWDAAGQDIYYTGSSSSPLPVDIRITYTLDGKRVTPEELAGKSGHVTMRFDYDNKTFETVTIGGKEETIFVPFMVVTGMVLDSDVFRHVEVTNARIVDDGDRQFVVGFVLPGLQETLDVDTEIYDFPEYLEVEADVMHFSLQMTMSVATNALFQSAGTDKADDLLDDLNEALDKLTDAMTQLMDGSDALYEGLQTLSEKTGTLSAGIAALSDGAASLQEGATSLQEGTKSLSDGLHTLDANSATLNNGAAQVFDALLSAANAQLAASGISANLTRDNYAQVLDSLMGVVDGKAYNTALDTVTGEVNANRDLIRSQVEQEALRQVRAQAEQQVREQVTAAVRESVKAGVIAQLPGAPFASVADYENAVAQGLVDDATVSAVEETIRQQMESETIQNTIAAQVTANMPSDAQIEAVYRQKVESGEIDLDALTEQAVRNLISQNMNSDAVKSQISAGASSGKSSLASLKSSLDNYNTFYNGLHAYTAGVSEAAKGADALLEGSGKLADGASKLHDGASTLQKNMPALTEGVSALRDGAKELSDGLKAFNEEGVQKLVSAFDDDLEGLVDRLRALREVSSRYNSFSGIADGCEGSVKFIWRTGAIQ